MSMFRAAPTERLLMKELRGWRRQKFSRILLQITAYVHTRTSVNMLNSRTQYINLFERVYIKYP